MMMADQTLPEEKPRRLSSTSLFYDLALILILFIGAAYRLVGLDWDADQNLHPDERFLTGVETGLMPVESLSDYFNTDESTLNPHNQGYGFFVYGTFPIFIVRYAAEWLGQTGWSEVNLVGRQLSALSDLFVVLLVYMISARLFDRRVGLLAAAFSTFTVLNIQLSHFFAVDTFLNFFTLLTIYAAVLIATDEGRNEKEPFRPAFFVFFGAALGMAAASKISGAVVAGLLPVAVFVQLSKMSEARRREFNWTGLQYMALAAGVSLLVFRVLQPYAFSGPGFLGIGLNEKWVENMKSLRAQVAGDVDWPPSIQWARRPLWFSLQNMVIWGMGLPLGVAAWAGFLLAAWRMIKGEWRVHLVLWGWTAFYFGWQSLAFNPTMRYQLPVYAPLAIYAAWGLVAMWGKGKEWLETRPKVGKWLRGAALATGAAVLGATVIYATAFISIYQQPVTRVAASDWIYQNVPGPLTLVIETEDGIYNQPLSYPYDYAIQSSVPYNGSFTAKAGGMLEEVHVNRIVAPDGRRAIVARVVDVEAGDQAITSSTQEVVFDSDSGGITQEVHLPIEPPITLGPGKIYLVQIGPGAGQGPVELTEITAGTLSVQGEGEVSLLEAPVIVSQEALGEFTLSVEEETALTQLKVGVRVAARQTPGEQTLHLSLDDALDHEDPLARAELTVDLSGGSAEGLTFKLDRPVAVEEGALYHLRLAVDSPGETVTLQGAAIGVEAPWDDPIPMRTSGYDAYGGIYQRDLNFDLYADDNPEKLADFLGVLEAVDYYTISSSRQWASTTRIPERYPLNRILYRELLGCPEDKTIEWCYNVAVPGMFEGNLGFELVKVFQSDPALGRVRINDQFSEEAFTVYDHPKVFIFQKSDDYDHEKVTEMLSAVDFSRVVRLTPKTAGNFKDLLLPPDRLSGQREGGTWSDLFGVEATGAGAQAVSLVGWYLAVGILGVVCYPLVRLALSGLPDKGYPLARASGLLFLAYLSWVAGSVGLGFSRGVIWSAYILILGLGLWQGYRQREELKAEWAGKRKYFLTAEGLFLTLFLLSLLVRFGNPDLWHPFKGGEKPMDFSYFNAVLKSSSFPPYDPWYAGGYINYYYYGFVYVGVLVKMLGIVPSVAYNLIIPTLFAMLSVGAFSVGWNLVKSREGAEGRVPYYVGLAAGLMTGLLGNLGSLRMTFWGLARLGSNGLYAEDAYIFTKLRWAAGGVIQVLSGARMPYGLGDYYWIPSRVISATSPPEPITEFPWFTMIYADLHAHMISLPITVLALSWALSLVLGKFWGGKPGKWQTAWSLTYGGLAIGALRGTNTWDLPTYLALGAVALIYAALRHYRPPESTLKTQLGEGGVKLLAAGLAVVILTGLVFTLYLPYANWYSQPYSSAQFWDNDTSNIDGYLTHWGLFLFILTTWLAWETRKWMAETPLSSLRKLENYSPILVLLGLVFAAVFVVMLVSGTRIHLLALPLAAWAAVLLLRTGLPEAKRAMLFMTGTGLFLTMMVEEIVLTGDIGRMNTVFKFYLQVWVLFAATSAAALGWLYAETRQAWNGLVKDLWLGMLTFLALGAAMFPLIGTYGKVRDRMAEDAPHTLDGAAFIPYSVYHDQETVFDLGQDYEAIRWLQANVEGSPVIVEGNTPLYRWGSRMTIYTGLPGVLGWDWHQTQQRGFVQTSDIEGRRNAIKAFYETTDAKAAAAFLTEYDVRYIIVGQLERAYYPGAGLDKFDAFDGDLWFEVYREGEMAIYQVNQEALESE